MEIAALVILILSSVIGFGAIFFTTFGTLIILVGAVAFAIMTEFLVIDINTLIVLLLFYLVGEIFEYISVVIGTKKLGASNAAVWGALIGGVVGAVLGSSVFGFGFVIGTFLGIFLGAFIVEWCFYRDLARSIKAGIGGVLGRVGSIAAKVVIAIIMFGIIIFSLISYWR